MTDWEEIIQQRPKDIDEAIPCMRRVLDYYHARNDYRAVFLRAYYIITVEVHAAVHQLGDYQEQIFFDPQWIASLAGKFSSLYLESLTTSERAPEVERAWKVAHELAETRRSTVLQDLLLGLNAHINYDLAYGIFLNFKEHGDDDDHLRLPRRKFDHDQVNNILARCTPKIQEVLARDYGGGILFLSRLFGKWDEKVAGLCLQYYRERVWWNAVSYLAATDEQEIGLVQAKLNWESHEVTRHVTKRTLLNQVVGLFGRLLRKRRLGKIQLEELGGIRDAERASRKARNPFGVEVCDDALPAA